jgi:hypothetical protein
LPSEVVDADASIQMLAVVVARGFGDLHEPRVALEKHVGRRGFFVLCLSDNVFEFGCRVRAPVQVVEELRVTDANRQVVRVGTDVGGEVRAGGLLVSLFKEGGGQTQVGARIPGVKDKALFEKVDGLVHFAAL